MIDMHDINSIVSKQLNIPIKDIDELNRIQYEFLLTEIAKNESNVSLIHIGKWVKRSQSELNRKVYQKRKPTGVVKTLEDIANDIRKEMEEGL